MDSNKLYAITSQFLYLFHHIFVSYFSEEFNIFVITGLHIIFLTIVIIHVLSQVLSS